MLDMTTAANCFLFSIFIEATDKGYFVPKSKQASTVLFTVDRKLMLKRVVVANIKFIII